jgi:hypothetical protein
MQPENYGVERFAGNVSLSRQIILRTPSNPRCRHSRYEGFDHSVANAPRKGRRTGRRWNEPRP